MLKAFIKTTPTFSNRHHSTFDKDSRAWWSRYILYAIKPEPSKRKLSNTKSFFGVRSIAKTATFLISLHIFIIPLLYISFSATSFHFGSSYYTKLYLGLQDRITIPPIDKIWYRNSAANNTSKQVKPLREHQLPTGANQAVLPWAVYSFRESQLVDTNCWPKRFEKSFEISEIFGKRSIIAHLSSPG